ncbi:proto-oncogene tyrosine-protein kinase ROS isoform X2 [Aricia agestis]|uniref:proto-oncogene tyrosine-protein kinase ROS isoform X2 n=1 Tax=Aricia agestis TaxID=91739 RepID=UPI001C204AE7|nr:proto-oncogene tyrosine-protein kinase ROS isoform X2 [Aricia agestis]
MSGPRNWHKWLVLVGLALSARTIAADYSFITEKSEAMARCNEKCPFQNRTSEGHYDVSCGPDCSVQQCRLGCSLWSNALETSCQAVCNVTSETVISRELYCVMGCNEALNTYFQMIRDLIGTPPAPALVADSLTATSLSLLWDAPTLDSLSYLLQWRYEELSGTWQYYSNTSHTNKTFIHVENLRPYTKYRFRVAIFLSGRGVEPMYSAPSVVISTSDSGKPSSAPAALRAVAIDSSRVAVSWEPGPFPNGPLLSYVLRLADTQPNTNDALEDMPASNNTLFYMFQNLAPSREYEVSVAMRNLVGEGPRAYVRIKTPPLPASTPSQQPILILGGEHKILAAPANDMLSVPVELYNTEHIITGVGIDLSSDSLFVSVSSGFVYRSTLSNKSASEPILTPKNMAYKPLDLSVDWLNRHLYVLGEVYYTKEDENWSNASVYSNWEISRCDFDGKNQIVALSGFNTRPIHFEVDAYNGYLFWALRGLERGGLYRLDLANISNGVPHNAPPEHIVKDAHLGPFTVDHTDFRILVAHYRRNTVLAVSLDGREITDFRSNTQTPKFFSVKSLAYANGLFYWTNGQEMLTEEYHPQKNSYFHNEYPLEYDTRQVLVALRSCQPIPLPVNPPLSVQSIMGIDRGKVSWSPPHLLGHQGTGAWQQWMYHLQLTEIPTGKVIDIKNISDSIYHVDNLKENTEYVIKVAAVTQSGSGPWSSEFVGKTLTLSQTTLQSTLLWSGPDGLLQTDLTGENLQTLIHKEHLRTLYITDISWYRDKLYLVTNASTVIWYNITSHIKGEMPNMDNVGSLAVDWVGKKIYWSNPKQQLITRENFDGSNREPVPIVTVAKELNIDSLGAYIYWSTGHAVEGARLNGENKIVYYPAQLFSGKQVMGLTVDLEKKWLYWLVRSYDGSELHRAATADQIALGLGEVTDTLVTRLSGTATLGPLCYFSERLVWVQDASRAVVSDLAGRYTAELVPRVHVIAVRDPSLHRNSELINAIPEKVNASSIAVRGDWDQFNVTWSPATRVNINNTKVFYDVSLHFTNNVKIERTVDVPWVSVSAAIAPYTRADVTVRAHTPWGGGAPAHAHAHSPQAPPSAPRRPRLYLQPAYSGSQVSATFRWEVPERANGVIRGYEAQCWMQPVSSSSNAKPSACADARLSPLHTQLMLRDLVPSSQYYFRVRAFTDAGFGQYSEEVSALSDEVNPVPKVMISSQDSIKITDLDTGESETIPKSTGTPIDFVVAIEENIAYWVNNLEEIFSSRINGTGHYKLTSINGSATSICVDWVSRSVYWIQREILSTESYVMYRIDLGIPNTRHHVTQILSSKQPMYSLQISPLTRTLYWYEESNHTGLGVLMTSKVNGFNVRQFFNTSYDFDKETRENCDCPENPQIAKAFVLDLTSTETEIYWVDPWVHRIVATDTKGCKCRTVMTATEKKKYGFTPSSITVDSSNIYWYDSADKTILFRNKFKIMDKIERVKVSMGYKIFALDPANQPYPDRKCLIPNLQELTPKSTSNTANSITLQMPTAYKPIECRRLEYEMPLTEFTIYYRKHSNESANSCDKNSCPFITTTSSEVAITDLSPFTRYSFMLEATNYYGKLQELKPAVGPQLVLQTAAEAPTAPKDVRYVVLSPVLVRVEWTIDPGLSYELHWRTDDSTLLPHNLKEHNTFEVPEGNSANMTRLVPNTAYIVWVRARSRHSPVPADSAPLRLRTRPTPAPLALRNITAYNITVSWPRPTTYDLYRYAVEYSEVSESSDEWRQCTKSDDMWVASDLTPSTRYRFRLRLQYIEKAPLFYWPPDDKFVFETLGDVPGAPGEVRVAVVGSRVLRAWWPEPDPRGAPVTAYRLWGRPYTTENYVEENITRNVSDLTLPQDLPSDVDPDMKMLIAREGLELLHNGSDSYWIVHAEDLGSGWWVRVQGRNAHGWGAASPPAAVRAPPARSRAPPAALAVGLAAIAVLGVVFAAVVFYAYNNRTKKKAALESQALTVVRRGPDVELATLRQLPIRHSTNILYNQGVHLPSDAEIAGLPHIRREQITLTKFLGSGAFGEVFEGIARNLISGDTKVAVKTLRKGATEQEKNEFLKEAALMSNFKHEHILRLLGVCLDNDPNYIIMELMEGGDLLSYLRAKRASLYTEDSLTLLDLLNMCVDVTRGCRYLEEMHFVHRDLAARNCLVASRAARRVVKIGDFGLARDIYKNDYYRKEGEGLLPVRWMAVECLMDGVFTCQSDVWAWGVLCGEILSLGQQPYPARTNRQVLAYVRAGGTPDRPPNCPSAFYELLQKCWSYNAELRPSFRQCLEVVCELRDKTSPNITLTATPQPAPQYLTLLPDDEDFPEQQMEPSHLLPRPLKYIELRYDSDTDAIRDGYEIPRTPFSRHSIVGVAPNRLIKPLYRTHSLRARPPNATITPLRNGIVKRASLCGDFRTDLLDSPIREIPSFRGNFRDIPSSRSSGFRSRDSPGSSRDSERHFDGHVKTPF